MMMMMIPIWRAFLVSALTFAFGLGVCPEHYGLAKWIVFGCFIAMIVGAGIEHWRRLQRDG